MQIQFLFSLVSRHRSSLTGFSLVIMLVTFLLQHLTSSESLIPSIAAWLALLLAWPALPPVNRQQCLILMTIGVVCVVISAGLGARIPWSSLLGNYVPLLCMLVAVSFLRLLASRSEEALPSGRRAIGSTLAEAHLLGAVLNLSILAIMGDRMARCSQLTLKQVLVIGRGFTFAALWSPFFVAMNVSLLSAPGMSFAQVFPVGAVIAVCALILSWWHLRQDAADFQGYPLNRQGLSLPVGLAALVIAAHQWSPQLSVTLLITILAPSVALALSGIRQRARCFPAIAQHVSAGLGRMGGELALFLAAGVLSVGLTLITQQTGFSLPLHHFGALEASILFPFILILAWSGVHAMISVAVLSPILLPLQPNPNMLGFMFLSSWAMGSGSSPLSGMNLMLALRYGVRSKQIWRAQAPFFLMLLPLIWAGLFWLDN